MKNKQLAPSLRRRVALLLLVSFFNFVASPLLFASKGVNAVLLNPPQGTPTHFIRRVSMATNDLVYSSATGRIHASRPSSAGSGGNSIAAIDPATGLITSSTFIGSEPNELELADDGQNLYAFLDGTAAIRRFNVQTNTPGLQFTLGEDSFFGRYTVSDLAVAPGNPNLLAVARQHPGVSPPGAGVAIFDNGIQRPTVGPDHSFSADTLAFSTSPTKLYGSPSFGPFQTMTIDASGVTVSSTSSLSSTSGSVKFSGGKLFTSLGHVINPDSDTLLGTFFGVNTRAFVPDATAGRVFYVTPESSFGTFSVKAFDINTFLLVGSITLTGVEGTPSSLLRWGPNGLAFRTSGNQLFIIQTSLIPSAEPIPTPTPTPSPTPSPSPSPAAAAFIRKLDLSTNDLIHVAATQKLYASVPSNQGITGNSVAEIDPVMGTILNQVFVGSEPTHLAPANDGQTLYVGLSGAAAIRKYDILSHTASDQFAVGRDNFFGLFGISDIAVSPGDPSVIAVARQNTCCSPSQAGVAIFDNGVQRPQTGPDHIEGSDFLVWPSGSTLYGNNFRGLTTMTVSASGVTVTDTSPFAAGSGLIFSNNLLYGSTGQVINPTTGNLVGTFAAGGFNSTHAIDAANNRAFFLVSDGGGSNVQLRAFNLTNFLPVGFVNIGGVSGTPGSLVRWGSNGLAFRTSNRQLFLIETALVNPSTPVPTATPTPSPTPSPSPAIIATFVRQVDVQANALVSSPTTQALHASIPSSVGVGGNSIRRITPETGAVGPAIFVGSEPNKMALADDGATLYVHLDGANAVRRFNVVNGGVGLQFDTNSPEDPSDMEVIPGTTQGLAIARGNFSGQIAVYDNGVQRPNTGTGFFNIGAIEFGANASTIYGTNGSDLIKFLVDATGVTTSTTTSGLLGGSTTAFEFSEGRLFTGSGRVVDPETGTLFGTFQGTSFAPAMVVDAANDRAFYAFNNGSNIQIVGFDTNTFVSVGSITLPGISSTPVNLVRWGTNGLAFNTAPFFGSGTRQVFILQTALVSNAGTIPTGLQLESNTHFTNEGTPALAVRVARTGNPSSAVSINFATSNGTATAGSDYTATSGTLNFAAGEMSKIISIPILDDNVFENASETFTLTLSNPSGAILSTPSSTTITISDNEFRPFLFVSSGPRTTEGDSGTKNLAVTVTLSNASIQTVTVDFVTANGTATAGTDYTSTSGTLTIPAGSTSGTINVPITGDTAVEANETFTVNLSNATNVSFISSTITTAVIDNDDATFQFTDPGFRVDEADGFRTMTVTRVGDTSRVASVHFATNDTASLQPCTTITMIASERCDYATTVGRLQFAIGETSKTFIIPIVDDAIDESGEVLNVVLSGPSGATLGTHNTATLLIDDNDTGPATQNPIDGVEFFVRQQYIDFLGRLPDTIGFENWTKTLGNCPNGGFGEFDNPTCDRVHVSSGFFLSEEFQGRGYFAYKFYEVALDRRPTYFEFVPDMALVGGAQSPESEVLSKAAYTDAFVQRGEFRSRYDALSNTAYVNALETNAEVTLTNKTALVDALNASTKTRAQVLREIVELQSVSDKFFIRAFVSMQYFGYLRRDPDTVGFNNWVNTLTADPNNFRHMIFGFLFSTEYRSRFGP
jgi:Calx-beta domain